jgi:hypothetical protein
MNRCFHDAVLSGALKNGAVRDFSAHEPQNAARSYCCRRPPRSGRAARRALK